MTVMSQCINHMLNTLLLDRDKIIKGSAGFSWLFEELFKAPVAAFRSFFRTQTAMEKYTAHKFALKLSFSDFGLFLFFWNFDLRQNILYKMFTMVITSIFIRKSYIKSAWNTHVYAGQCHKPLVFWQLEEKMIYIQINGVINSYHKTVADCCRDLEQSATHLSVQPANFPL